MTAKIALTGKMRSGKDSVAGYLTLFYDYQPFAFGNALKQYANWIFGSYEGKPRALYQQFGQLCRQIDPDVWVRHCLRDISGYLSRHPTGRVVVTDLRQPNEYKRLKAHGFVIIRVAADDDVRIERMKAAGDVFTAESLHHETEQYIDSFDVDYEIENNGTLAELEAKVDAIMAELGITQREAFSG